MEAALAKKPALNFYCVGPAPICHQWDDWLGEGRVRFDPKMAAYYGLSHAAMADMLRYLLATAFGRDLDVPPPPSESLVRVHHPDYGDFPDLDSFLARAGQEGWDLAKAPRVALGTWRHHVLFHQPKVVAALIRGLARVGILAVCLVADDPGFQERLLAFEPDLVLMTSHTREPAAFWEKLGVPRIHALWFTGESIETWRTSNQTGMAKSSMFHQIVSAEVKGATECLTAGGTAHGGDSGEEILPIPDRINRIIGRVSSWISLASKANARQNIAIVVYDREADKAGMLGRSGPQPQRPPKLRRLSACPRWRGVRRR